jgi:hypothetical protein
MIMNANGILVVYNVVSFGSCGSGTCHVGGAPRRPERPPAETQTVTYQQTQIPKVVQRLQVSAVKEPSFQRRI